MFLLFKQQDHIVTIVVGNPCPGSCIAPGMAGQLSKTLVNSSGACQPGGFFGWKMVWGPGHVV